MRRFLPILLACALLLGGCAQSVADSYSDFLMNGDILQRFEVCFDDVDRGKETRYTQGELRALIQDLEEGYAVHDDQADEATRAFQESAEVLLAVLRDDPKPAESPGYKAARALFDEAWGISVRVRQGTKTD